MNVFEEYSSCEIIDMDHLKVLTNLELLVPVFGNQ